MLIKKQLTKKNSLLKLKQHSLVQVRSVSVFRNIANSVRSVFTRGSRPTLQSVPKKEIPDLADVKRDIVKVVLYQAERGEFKNNPALLEEAADNVVKKIEILTEKQLQSLRITDDIDPMEKKEDSSLIDPLKYRTDMASHITKQGLERPVEEAAGGASGLPGPDDFGV